MAARAYKVFVVVDRDFGERLSKLQRDVPVWIVDTPVNKPAAQQLWSQQPEPNHLTGVTTFKDMKTAPPEDLLLAQLDSIDLHHGSYSADPPYTVIEVIGAALTGRVKSELSEFGFSDFHPTQSGFVATRQLPSS